MQNSVAFQRHAIYEEERIALQFRQSFFEHQRLPFMNMQSRRIQQKKTAIISQPAFFRHECRCRFA